MEHRDPPLGAESGQGRLELEGLVDRLLHELLDGRLAPGAQRPAAEAARESLRPGETDPQDLAGFAVEHGDARIGEDLPHLVLPSRLVVVVAQHGDRGDPS